MPASLGPCSNATRADRTARKDANFLDHFLSRERLRNRTGHKVSRHVEERIHENRVSVKTIPARWHPSHR
jgi:hypothetical protein